MQIYDVIQDNNLNYWFATDQGLWRYDNHKFELIRCEEMKGFSVFGFVISKTGIIYCHNLNNQVLKIENNKCSLFYELKGETRSNNISLVISETDELILVSRTSVLFSKNGKPEKQKVTGAGFLGQPFRTKNGTIISHPAQRDSLLLFRDGSVKRIHINGQYEPLKGVLTFFRVNNHVYAISTGNKEVFSFDEENFVLYPLPANSLSGASEYLRFYDIGNELWIAGTVSGVQVLKNPEKNDVSEKMYTSHFVSDIYKDNEGNILLSTFNNGVLVIPDAKIPDVFPGSDEKDIVSIGHDKELGILMGSLHGELLRYKNGTYFPVSASGSKPLQSVYCWDDYRYVLFDDGLIKAYDKKSGKVITFFEASLKDAVRVDDESVYLALNMGVCKLKIIGSGEMQVEYLDSLRIRTNAIEFETATKSTYVASSDGLKMWTSDGKIENIFYKGSQVFANDMSAGNTGVYVSTQKDGILLLENGKVKKQIKPKDNKEEIEIYRFVVHDEKIYCNSSVGFIVLDMQGTIKTRLNMAQGFSTNKIFDFKIIGDHLWICHSKGVQSIKLELLNSKIEKPFTRIASLRVNDEETELNNSEAVFDHRQLKFSFTIASPALKSRETIKYHYKLVGYDNDWVVASYDDNRITYNALSPGEYTFIVKAVNQGVEGNEVSYSFLITKPFYARWWFITLSVSFFLLAVFIVYRRQLKIQQRKSDQLNELNASKLTAIQSQMNPHFIFNSLNSVQDLILKGDVEHSYTYIATFSDLVRKTLNYSEKDFIDFEQEIELLEIYLSLEKFRFKKDFDYTIEVNNVEDILLPPLLIQPFIENAMVHGLLHKEGKKHLKVIFELKDALVCTIEDNGIGREKAKTIRMRQRPEHESFSGRAIKKRFEILSNVFGNRFGYTYEDLSEKGEASGTRVILTIPVKHKF